MSRLLFDTTILVDTERAGLDLDDVVADDDDVAVAAVTVAELLVGVELASRAQRPARQTFVEEVRAAIPVIPYDSTVTGAHAELLVATRQRGQPRGAHDLIIAATAKATNREVVSADESAFEELPGVRTRSHRR